MPTAQQAEALCPDIGSTGLSFGKTSEELGAPLVARFTERGGDFGSFTEAALDFSAFSGRLYAVEYTANPDNSGDDTLWQKWSGALAANLTAAGWEPVDLPRSVSQRYFEAPAMQKTVDTPQGPQALLIEYSSDGVFSLVCASKAEFLRNNREELGDLAPATPRPPRPAEFVDLGPAIAGLDCNDPALIETIGAMIGKPGVVLPDIGHAIMQRIAMPVSGQSAANYETRLNTWLGWTMTNSGKIDAPGLWKVEEAAVPPLDLENPAVLGMAEAMDGVMQAYAKGDAPAICLAYREMLTRAEDESRRMAARQHAINGALEAEAARLGIDVS